MNGRMAIYELSIPRIDRKITSIIAICHQCGYGPHLARKPSTKLFWVTLDLPSDSVAPEVLVSALSTKHYFLHYTSAVMKTFFEIVSEPEHVLFALGESEVAKAFEKQWSRLLH